MVCFVGDVLLSTIVNHDETTIWETILGSLSPFASNSRKAKDMVVKNNECCQDREAIVLEDDVP